MNVYMTSCFQILHKEASGDYVPVSKDKLKFVSVGGFSFVINGHDVPFDWDAYTISEIEPGVFEYNTGLGPFFNDHELSKDYEEDLRRIGLTVEQLTAAYLASVSKIAEFHVSIDDLETEDISFGCIEDNADNNAEYRVSLGYIAIDDDTMPIGAEPYMIDPYVLDDFNRGGVDHGC